MKKMSSMILAVLSVLVFPVLAHADQPGPHPAYLHALTDLRHARANITRRPGDAQVKWDENTAIREIDAAIHEIKMAAIDDGKNVEDHPPVDERQPWGGRLHRALELLRKSRQDIQERESNDFARGLKRRAIEHIDLAINFTKQAIDNNRW